MINIIKVGEKDYPFHFGMRVFWHVSNSGQIEFDEVDGRIESDYDSFLKLFVIANKAAMDREGNEADPITTKQLEIAIDDSPKLMIELQNAFQNSSVIEKLQEAQAAGNEKKPKG